MRRSDTGALAVEIAWLRAAELPKLTRVEELLAGGASAAEPPARRARPGRPRRRPAPPSRASEPPPGRRATAGHRAPAPAAETGRDGRRRGAAAAPAPPPPSRPRDPITAFKEEAGKRKPNLGGFLDAAEDLRFEDGRVTVFCPAGDTYLRTRLEANRADPGRGGGRGLGSGHST